MAKSSTSNELLQSILLSINNDKSRNQYAREQASTIWGLRTGTKSRGGKAGKEEETGSLFVEREERESCWAPGARVIIEGLRNNVFSTASLWNFHFHSKTEMLFQDCRNSQKNIIYNSYEVFLEWWKEVCK
jgi:hypothetical protein